MLNNFEKNKLLDDAIEQRIEEIEEAAELLGVATVGVLEPTVIPLEEVLPTMTIEELDTFLTEEDKKAEDSGPIYERPGKIDWQAIRTGNA